MITRIEIVQGKDAPQYTEGREAKLVKMVVTEKGIKGGRPMVDFVAELPDGEQVVVVLGGQQIFTLAGAMHGINMRNHGVPEP